MTGTLDYLGLRLHRLTTDELLNKMKSAITQESPLTASYFGFHAANLCSAKEIEHAFKSLDVVMPDGIAVLWSSYLFGPPLTIENRINGDILGPLLYLKAIEEGWSIYLLGGAPGVASQAASQLKSIFPTLMIAGTHHGYLGSEEDQQAVIHEINNSKAVIVLVGMGQPIQEKWLVANKRRIDAPVLFAVGGYFDHLVRRIDCYPAWVYQWRLNWAYRLLKEPNRLWKRYTFGLFTFARRLLWAKYGQFL